eukprot:CAMPEP_0115414412 /NCGR_PEP_ID=MMETSP0271-20121206/22569_1 /TAXON_ID=71861 /ORGANISM="Scrippsiella trochoidea, Strain CCMP3099" /LENGTH=364 /DNA_ID=CAMNT_0002838715 /DNA_START=39 /DNA_END=1133 /DNA_ORIENTATION=-
MDAASFILLACLGLGAAAGDLARSNASASISALSQRHRLARRRAEPTASLRHDVKLQAGPVTQAHGGSATQVHEGPQQAVMPHEGPAMQTQSEEVAASLALSDRLLLAAKSPGIGDDTREMLTALALCTPCHRPERFGEPHDGGYLLCTDSLDSVSTVLSFGVNGFDGFGMDVVEKWGAQLHEYDCTNDKRPAACEGCKGRITFHDQCLRGQQEAAKDDYVTLDDIMQHDVDTTQSQHPGKLLMKMDIEGSEWPVLSQTSSDVLSHFEQAVVEFHWLDQVDKHHIYHKAVDQLAEAGLKPAHLHGNNNEGMALFGEYRVPNVLEVTFARQPAGTSCASGLSYHDAQDSPNNPNFPELALAHLPP